MSGSVCLGLPGLECEHVLPLICLDYELLKYEYEYVFVYGEGEQKMR